MAFTKIAAAGIGSTETVTLHSLEVLNNATVGGVLTYEDVTNVDSIGIVTARAGVLVGSGITLSKDGDGFFTGVITATSYSGIDLSNVTGAQGDFSIADKIIHTGDTNTALRFPAADTITAETAGSEALRIDSVGRVLIGGTSAVIASGDEFNEIVLTGKTRGAGITLQDTDANTRFQIRTDDNGDGTLLNASTNHPLIIRTNNTERFRIASDGDVNIGAAAANTGIDTATECPFSGATPKLEIKLGGASNSYTRLINIANPSGQTGSETLGRVGIKLSLGSESSKTESAKAGIIYAESTSTFNNSTSLCFATNNTETLRISSDNQVGIHTVTPNARLHILATNDKAILIEDSSNGNNAPYLEIIGKRTDGNTHQSFSGQVFLARNRTEQKISSGLKLGTILFGGNHTDASKSNILYAASIAGMSSGDFNSATDMKTDLVFFTGATGRAPAVSNVSSGDEAMRITSSGYVRKPLHPNFCARHTVSASYSAQDIVVYNSVSNNYRRWNIGGHYNTSDGKFTCPVDGIYYFEAQVMTTGWNNGDYVQDLIFLNSSQGNVSYPRQRRSRFTTDQEDNGYLVQSVAGQVQLSAGQTVWIVIQRACSVASESFSYFTGWLVQ